MGGIADFSGAVERVMACIERYFFRPRGEYGIAIARIALFTGIYVTGGGDLVGRFVLQPGQPLPWRAATLIEVREQGRPEVWPFIGPVAVW